jgi:hypothetical protein
MMSARSSAFFYVPRVYKSPSSFNFSSSSAPRDTPPSMQEEPPLGFQAAYKKNAALRGGMGSAAPLKIHKPTPRTQMNSSMPENAPASGRLERWGADPTSSSKEAHNRLRLDPLRNVLACGTLSGRVLGRPGSSDPCKTAYRLKIGNTSINAAKLEETEETEEETGSRVREHQDERLVCVPSNTTLNEIISLMHEDSYSTILVVVDASKLDRWG